MTAARHARRPAVSPAALEVNEARIWATNMGADWWNLWRARMEPTGRITVITASIGGDRVSIACDSKDDANWLRNHMISEGIHKSSVKVVTDRQPPAVAAAARVLIAVTAAAGLYATWAAPANVAPARPWHYPCVMHYDPARWGNTEWFTPRRLLMEGDCLQ